MGRLINSTSLITVARNVCEHSSFHLSLRISCEGDFSVVAAFLSIDLKEPITPHLINNPNGCIFII